MRKYGLINLSRDLTPIVFITILTVLKNEGVGSYQPTVLNGQKLDSYKWQLPAECMGHAMHQPCCGVHATMSQGATYQKQD